MTDKNSKRDNEILEAYVNDWIEHGSADWGRISRTIPHVELSTRQMRRIARREFKAQGYTDKGIEEKIKEFSAQKYPPEDTSVTFRENADNAIAISNNPQIRTLDQLIEACNVDLDVWEIKNWIGNAWGMGRKNETKHISWKNGVIVEGSVSDTGGWAHLQNFQIKAWFVPREVRPFELAFGDLIDELSSVSPKYDIRPLSLDYKEKANYLFVPSIFDAHFNKRSATGSWTLEKAAEEYKKIVDRMISKAVYRRLPIKHVLYIPGQDMLNADSLNDKTTWGTWVESVNDLRNAVDVVCDVSTYAVEQFSQLAPTSVLPVPGNHDRYGMYWLGKFLEARFMNHNYVNVFNDIMPRRYFLFGNTLLGIDHGDKVKPRDLALTMAVEYPEQWGKSTHREFLRGHFHKATEMYFSMTTEKGVVVRVLPALCPTDMWHVVEGYIGNRRSAEALFYHEENGYDGAFSVFVDELD